MNIAILGLTATSYGSLTYLKNLLPHLAQMDSANQYQLFLPAASAPELDVHKPNFHVHLYRWPQRFGALRVLWEQLVLPWILRMRGVDAVYTTHSMAILFSAIPNIILMQNVEPFFAGRFPNPPHLRLRLHLLRMMMEFSLRRRPKIIAISDWEKEFLAERFCLPPDRIVVSYPGVAEGFAPPAVGSEAALRAELGIAPPYILSAPRLAGYGNLLNLAKAYVSLVKAGKVAMPLVVPGGVWDTRYIGGVKKMLAAEGCAKHIKFLGYVPRRHMALLFGHATCFVFPSLLEACGTVLIEALACGTPILCCRRRPMCDVVGGAAVLFDGEDPGDIAEKLGEVLSNPALRQNLSRRAVARAREFSWRHGAEKLDQILRLLAPARHATTYQPEPIPPERGSYTERQ